MESRSFSARWYKCLLAGAFAMFSAFIAGPLLQDYPAIAATVGLPLAVLAVRAGRIKVVIHADGMLIRGLYRTRRIPWEEIVDVVVGPGSGVGLRWRIPVVVLRVGSVRIEDLRSLREPSVVDRAVAQAQTFLALRTSPGSDGWE
jgi:hypothetical protein